MVTLLDFVAELIVSAVRLLIIFVTDVIVQPSIVDTVLSGLSALVGALLFAFSFGFGLYLVGGAVVDGIGDLMPSPGRTPPQRD